jgi:ribosomal protein S18 acetylase RimI-like enzyme
MDHVERILKQAGIRIMLVETSGLDQFEQTRSFYEQKGFTLEGRVRDFYQDGEDKVIYWKRLN